MKKIISLMLGMAGILSASSNPNQAKTGEMSNDVAVAYDGLGGTDRVTEIALYGKTHTDGLGQLFTMLQESWFAPIFLVLLVAVPLIFLLHFMAIGPKVFAHDGKQIFCFSVFERAIHAIAGISFLVIVPTGLIMMFGTELGGGAFVKGARTLHFIFTLPFIVAVVPMTLIWLKDMLPTSDDIKWLFILGGYLSKEKKPVPAGRFNAGQKMWFYSCTFGGMVMIATGLIMYYRTDFSILGMSPIDTLRGMAIVHNVLGMAVMALFFTHIYMAVFAIQGAIHSIISGYKPEEEVEILHSSWYKELKKEGKL